MIRFLLLNMVVCIGFGRQYVAVFRIRAGFGCYDELRMCSLYCLGSDS